ncbi:MAG: hypothetical protein U0T69_13035 [Chitinophagales bacterium]
MKVLKINNIYLYAIVFAILIIGISSDLPFFWDTILTSTITQHFYNNGFQNFIIPTELDAGHPPLFYVYVTVLYHLLGKSLFTAHLAILPFTILGIVSFIQLMISFSFNKKQQIIGIILFFSIPAVITQNTLVSYDVVLLSLYLAALVNYLKLNKILFSFILIGIACITLRGLFCMASLSVTIYFLEKRNINGWIKWNFLFLPAIIICGCWYYYHYTQTGWLFATTSSGWSEQRGFTDFKGSFKNCISLARCFFDLGVVVLLALSFFFLAQKRKPDAYTYLWIIPALLFSIAFLPFRNPINHRYFLIVYVLMLLPVIQFLSERKIIYTVFTALILLFGHFQIYPVPISNGWDCTLVYLSYISAKDDFDNLNARDFRIDKSKVGTVFPMNTSLYQTNMNGDTVRLINVNGKTIDSVPFILYSNVGNDFSDKQINQLKNWTSIASFNRNQIDMILYKNPALNPK